MLFCRVSHLTAWKTKAAFSKDNKRNGEEEKAMAGTMKCLLLVVIPSHEDRTDQRQTVLSLFLTVLNPKQPSTSPKIPVMLSP